MTDLDQQDSPPYSYEADGPTLGWEKNFTHTGTVATMVNTRALIPGTTIPAGTAFLQTAGFATPGDGGGALYVPVGANPGIDVGGVQSLDGQWWKIVPAGSQYFIEQFGGKADWNGTTGTDNLTPINSMFAAATYVPDTNMAKYPPVLRFGIGSYYFSGLIQVTDVTVHMLGSGSSGFLNRGGTNFFFPVDSPGIQFNNSNTLGNTTRPVVNTGAQGSILENIDFNSLGGTSAAAHGIRWRTQGWTKQCGVLGFPGDAIHIEASAGSGGNTEGNCNDWAVENCWAKTIGGDALHVAGADANGGHAYGWTTHKTVGGCGVYDQSSVGANTYVNLQLTGYGDTGVWFGGRIYELISAAAGAGAATTPGTNDMIWYDRGAQAAPNGPYPTWSNLNTYKLTRPFYSNGAPLSVTGVYVEGSGFSQAWGPVMVIGAIGAWTKYSNQVAGVGGSTSALRIAQGFGGRIDFQAGDPGAANNGTLIEALVGTTAPAGSGAEKGMNILEHLRQIDSDTSWKYGYNRDVGPDIYYSTIEGGRYLLLVTTPSTNLTFGRSAIIANRLALNEPVLMDNNFTGRVIGIRNQSPQTGEAGTPHAQGEFYYNIAPTVDGNSLILLGWSCTASGTPGTFTPCYVKTTSP
jgi:hypothetical protein